MHHADVRLRDDEQGAPHREEPHQRAVVVHHLGEVAQGEARAASQEREVDGGRIGRMHDHQVGSGLHRIARCAAEVVAGHQPGTACLRGELHETTQPAVTDRTPMSQRAQAPCAFGLRQVRSNGSRHARGAMSWCTEFGPQVPCG